MTDVHSNGGSKIIQLSKPVENTANIIAPTTSLSSATQWKPLRSCGPERTRVTPRRHIPLLDRNNEDHLSNQKKQRYWNSWEELFIVELWRRYRDEVTIINVPLPVYRKMMIAMRNRNMMVTAQDCRRKINTLNARYKQELKRIETTGCKSDWRLFPLVDCVLQPKIKEFDPWHETKVIKKLLDKLPKPVEEKIPVPIINNNSHQSHHVQHFSTTLNASSYQQRSIFSSNTNLINTSLNAETLAAYRLPPSSSGHFEKITILPFRNITIDKIEQLRQHNNRLAIQRDEDLKRLRMEEENFNCFETFIRIWTEQKELELSRAQLLTEQNVINIENGEKHNVEQQLQETVVAK